MNKSRNFDRLCILAAVVMLIVAALVWVAKDSEGRQQTIDVGYESLFDKSKVHTIDIQISDWEGFIATATNEEYVACTIVIDGQKMTNVALRAKGNTSLSSVATQDSEKYSMKIEFDHYMDGKLFNGLDKLSLNNLIYDSTMMKDYLAYTLMGEMGVPSPLCSFANVTVNGENWGLYLAVEAIEDSFLQRNNLTRGELYKPDSMSFGGGRGNGRDFDFEQFRVGDDEEESTSTSSQSQMPQMPSQGGFPGGMPGGNMPGGNMPTGNMPTGGFPSGGEMPSMGDFTPPTSEDGSGERPTFSIAGFAGGFNFGMGSSDVKLSYIDDDPDSYSNIFNNAKTDISKADKRRLIQALKDLSEGKDIEHTVYTNEVINYLAVHDFLQNDDSYTGMMVHNYYLYEEDGQLAIIPWDYNLAFGGMNGSDGTSLVNSPIDSPVSNGDASDRPLVGWIFEDEEAVAKYHETYNYFVTQYLESGWLVSEIKRVAEMIRPYVEKDQNSFYSVEEFDEGVSNLLTYCSLRTQSIRGQLDGTIPSTTSGQRANSSSLVDGSSMNVSAMGSMNTGGGGDRGGFDRSSDRSSDMSQMPSMDQMPSMGGERPSMPGNGGDFPSDFTPPGMQSSASKTNWLEIGIYVLILLAAIFVVWLVRKYND